MQPLSVTHIGHGFIYHKATPAIMPYWGCEPNKDYCNRTCHWGMGRGHRLMLQKQGEVLWVCRHKSALGRWINMAEAMVYWSSKEKLFFYSYFLITLCKSARTCSSCLCHSIDFSHYFFIFLLISIHLISVVPIFFPPQFSSLYNYFFFFVAFSFGVFSFLKCK